MLIDAVPNFEEFEAIGYKYSNIAYMNNFDKLMAQHMIRMRKDEVLNTHDERQKELNRLIERLKLENHELHEVSS